ncbi:MAG: hypothetical protein IJK86_00570 [Lachnospiraceae bacterium]|nr:hypothetical protein [Lachnospiraceae bacterium]
MANNTQKKLNWRVILGFVLAAVLIYLVLSGRLSLSGGNDPAATADPGISVVTGEAQPTSVTTATPATTEAPLPIVTEQATKATAPPTQAPDPAATTSAADPTTTAAPSEDPVVTHVAVRDYRFRNKVLLESHYDKHGKEMGFRNAKEYEAAASAVINNPASLYKTEKEDGDHVFFLEDTGEFVVLSVDGYIRTYYYATRKYFDRQ